MVYLKENTMPVTYRTITTKTTIPAPIAYPADGNKVVVDGNNSNNLQYSGTVPLDNFGTPPTTGTVEPIIIDGETGINPWAVGGGGLGYTYLFINGALLVKVLGIQFLSGPTTAAPSNPYLYLIQTDTDCSSISSVENFRIVFAKLVGYSGIVGDTDITINGVAWPANSSFNESQLSPQSRQDGFWPAILIDASSSTVSVTENS